MDSKTNQILIKEISNKIQEEGDIKENILDLHIIILMIVIHFKHRIMIINNKSFLKIILIIIKNNFINKNNRLKFFKIIFKVYKHPKEEEVLEEEEVLIEILITQEEVLIEILIIKEEVLIKSHLDRFLNNLYKMICLKNLRWLNKLLMLLPIFKLILRQLIISIKNSL